MTKEPSFLYDSYAVEIRATKIVETKGYQALKYK